MIPRGSNPHLRLRPIQSVPRAEIFVAQDSEGHVHDSELQKQLEEIVRANLDTTIIGRARKRRKLDSTPGPEETSVSFRLLSTTHTISLLPRPPPPPITREPECEDNETAAETRRRQAEAVAVDASWVMQESQRLPPPFRVGRVQRVQARPEILGEGPFMMLAHCLQSPRKTRPPVPRSQLKHYPYTPAPILPTSDVNVCVPSVDVVEVPDTPLVTRKTRNRRRGQLREKARPQATFWWPEAGSGGKSLGYGMGYSGR